jgi:formyl-CoA transferase
MGLLAGVRVRDVSQIMAEPYGCMLLGEMGADVIKNEPPRRDRQNLRLWEIRV